MIPAKQDPNDMSKTDAVMSRSNRRELSEQLDSSKLFKKDDGNNACRPAAARDFV
jgi:hypothetical protein